MKPFKFFQRESKGMYSRLIERLRTDTNITTHRNFATNDDFTLINNMDYEVVALVQRYFNGLGGGTMETDAISIMITEISDNLGGDINVTVNVRSRINPYQTLVYSLVGMGGNIVINEKSVIINERL